MPNACQHLAKATTARVDLQSVVIQSLNRKEGEIGNPLKQADSAGPPQDQPGQPIAGVFAPQGSQHAHAHAAAQPMIRISPGCAPGA